MTVETRTGHGHGGDDLVCPTCGAVAPAGATYCEACGCRLAPSAGEQGAGPELPVESVRRSEIDLGVAAAAVTDRGRRRSRNEDAAQVVAGTHGVAAVVCDGVASTDDAHRASQAAALGAMHVLESMVGSPQARSSHMLHDALHDAIRRAQTEVEALEVRGTTDPSNSPSTTLVAAVALRGTVGVTSVGDSRAYWLTGAPDRCRLLTVDDSWAQEQIAVGVDAELANAHPEAHTITRWIGAGAEPLEPGITRMEASEPGHVVLCTDGLWNYFGEPERLGRYAADSADRTPLGIARHLVRIALRAGGHDNISVAVIPVEPATTAVHPIDERE